MRLTEKEFLETVINYELSLVQADIRVADIIADPEAHRGWQDKYTFTKEQAEEWKEMTLNALHAWKPRMSKKALEKEFGYIDLQYGLSVC